MNTSYEKLSFYNSYFGGTIEGDNILSGDFYGNKTIVGVTLKKYQETVDLLNEYYNKLVDLGVIVKEKTPEEIAKEQQDMMKAMMLQMQEMQEKIDSMSNKQVLTKEENNGKCEYESSKQYNEQAEFESNSTTRLESINSQSQRDFEFSKQSNRSITKS